MAPRQETDVGAMAFFNMARRYHDPADQLFDVNQRRLNAGDKRSLRDPIYFLYFHTMELALKAFLRSHNLAILGTERKNHRLTSLYEECRTLGLTIGPADRFQIGNIVSLLETGNEFQGFRYFNLKSNSLPDMSWTREVVGELMRAVEAHLAPDDPKGTIPGHVAKMTITFGKPTKS